MHIIDNLRQNEEMKVNEETIAEDKTLQLEKVSTKEILRTFSYLIIIILVAFE